jgi:hypothetical protein
MTPALPPELPSHFVPWRRRPDAPARGRGESRSTGNSEIGEGAKPFASSKRKFWQWPPRPRGAGQTNPDDDGPELFRLIGFAGSIGLGLIGPWAGRSWVDWPWVDRSWAGRSLAGRFWAGRFWASPLPGRALPSRHRIRACRAAAAHRQARRPSNAACPPDARRRFARRTTTAKRRQDKAGPSGPMSDSGRGDSLRRDANALWRSRRVIMAGMRRSGEQDVHDQIILQSSCRAFG